ncbi:MAG TPA: hypothetical protein VKB29_05830 [Candidatus Binataceae bacterium]|nr:hypothetical protein [Candidatus Binataceae bacterium]
MPDLGNRANVMGPQPIGPIKQPAPEMMAAIDRFLAVLMAGNPAEALAMTDERARDRVAQIAGAIKPGIYKEMHILGKARIVEHYFIKARLSGSRGESLTLQFRIGPEGGRWTVREAADLTNLRSAWTK